MAPGSVLDCTPKTPRRCHTGADSFFSGVGMQTSTDAECPQVRFTKQRGTSMGDRGGKKDKKKNQQQLATKQKHKEQQKLDKAPSKTPLAATT